MELVGCQRGIEFLKNKECHFNECLKRDIQKKADGTEVMRISWPKFKLGEESVRKVPVAPTYGSYCICFHP